MLYDGFCWKKGEPFILHFGKIWDWIF